MPDKAKEKRFLFEVSWEVCNKVGGIYTVLKSKLAQVKREFGNNYCLIGPLFENNPELIADKENMYAPVKDELQRYGFTFNLGTWKTEEKPLVILIKYKDALDSGKLLYQLWEDYGVDSMTGGWDYLEPVIFSTMAGKVIEALSNLYKDYHILAQFHEWMCGAGLLYIKSKIPQVASIFTTHATVLGRSMAGNGVDIYKILSDINPAMEASKINVLAKYSMEAATAREADCFSTVSEITAIEAKHLLKMDPDIVLPNGFNVKKVPDYNANQEYFKKSREKLLSFAGQFLQKDFSAKNSVILSTSGRYEFHNKGVDLLLDALGEINRGQDLIKNKNLLVFFFVITGSVDMSRERQVTMQEKKQYTVYSQFSTHPLWDPNNDPIINACRKNGLNNSAQDFINIIFVPVYLNGHDGVLNMEYYDTLAGCDLSVYASYYEPWGYTPLESLAYSVPTISTDVSGFGRWILSLDGRIPAVKILKRFDQEYLEVVNELKEHIIKFVNNDGEKDLNIKAAARKVALEADWAIFFSNYLQAYNLAGEECHFRLQGTSKKKVAKFRGLQYRGADSQIPRFRQFSVKASIPDNLAGLRYLSYNLWWSWHQEANELFSLLNAILYEKIGNNPVGLIETIEPRRLEELADNEEYLSLYKNIMERFDSYCSQKKSLLAEASLFTKQKPIVYFSMEYGFHESLPIYSGGLGILSGDHVKSASDLNLNMVGIGLLYKHGYFKQGISREGEQKAEYYNNDFFRMPLQEVNKDGEKLIIGIEFPGRMVYARVWEAQVGRVPVYLMDTDIPENSPADRVITEKLYGGGHKNRIEQEILLGIGGIRILEKLNIEPLVYHLNEGHSAFLIIERLIHLLKVHKLSLDEAREVIKSSTVFTTHTPVPAGNQTFDMQLVENYLKDYVEGNGLNWQIISELGHKYIHDSGPYEMTPLALKNTHRRNGVSRLHGHVSRRMWSDIWQGFLTEEVPILHITNGVHVGTWLTSEMKKLIKKYCSLNLNEDLLKKEEWKKIKQIPDQVLWQTHINLKNKLFNYIKQIITNNWTREGEDPALLDRFLVNLSSSPLTIGFARRFATYKRPTLFLKYSDRFKRLLTNTKYPVQFIFAGKAHPDDKMGSEMIKEIVTISKKDEFLGKIIFLEGYNMNLARRMVSGVDVWLNNPRRPFEASGTSGQKAGINGAINCSILDGWWDEAYDENNGFAIGSRQEYKNVETQDRVDCDSFYDILENKIIPIYYSRNSAGIPDRWIKIMKQSIISIISQYNTNRMLKDYYVNMYLPTAKRHININANDSKVARQCAKWKESIRIRFPSVHINNISIHGVKGENLNVNDEIELHLDINKGKVKKEEITAQLLIAQHKTEDTIVYSGSDTAFGEDIEYINMQLSQEDGDTLKYSVKYKAKRSGKFNYGIRIMPYNPDVEDIMDLNLVYWG